MQTELVLESNENVPPGFDLLVTTDLPRDVIAMLPDSVSFDGSTDDWQIVDVRIGNRTLRPNDWAARESVAIRWPLSASDLVAAIADGRLKLETIQARMTVGMLVRTQRTGLRFRCVLSGRACVYSSWTRYRRSKIAELRSYVPGEALDGVSIAEVDRQAGSPRAGDMIARNPKNHADQWLVAAAYFADNFEPLEPA